MTELDRGEEKGGQTDIDRGREETEEGADQSLALSKGIYTNRKKRAEKRNDECDPLAEEQRLCYSQKLKERRTMMY